MRESTFLVLEDLLEIWDGEKFTDDPTDLMTSLRGVVEAEREDITLDSIFYENWMDIEDEEGLSDDKGE